MMVSMETYLRRGRRSLQRLMLDPRVRSGGMILAYLAGGFLLSAAGLLEYPQPLAMGLICAASGWRAALLCLGAMAGYPTVWGAAGKQGIVWAASGGRTYCPPSSRALVRPPCVDGAGNGRLFCSLLFLP